MKLRVKSKAHGYRKNLLFTAMAVFALLVQPMYALVAEQVANAASVTDWTSLTSELNGSDSVIDITGIVEVPANETITVNRNVTINGGTLKAIGAGESGVTDAVVYVTGGATLTMNNTVVDGNNQTQRQGIKVYSGSHVVLNGVTIQNNKKTGLHVNGTSTAIVTGITTENNGASYGGMAVSGGGKITIDGQSHHTNEGYGLYDVRIDGSGTITDNKNQYKTTGQYYKLKSAPVAPVFISPTPSEGSTVASTSATVKWSPSATSSSRLDVVRYDVTLSGPGGVQVVPGVPAGGSLELTFDDLVDGAYTATVTAIGTFGESSNPVATRNFTVHVPDTTAPDAPVLTAPGFISGVTSNKYNITESWNKPSADTVSYEYKYWNNISDNDYEGESKALITPRTTESTTEVFNQGDGTHYMQVRAIDAAGNKSAWSNTFVVIYDGTAPTYTITDPIAGDTFATAIHGNKLTVHGSFNDNVGGSGANYIELQLVKDGNPAGPNSGVVITHGAVNNGVLAEFDTTGLPDGEYYINVLDAADASGNWAVAPQASIKVYIDNTAPDAPVLNNSPVYVGIAQTTGVPATWTHSGTDVAYYEYREYRTKALADADVNADINGEAGAYWVPDRTSTDANNKSQAVGHSWKTSVNLYYRVVAVDALGNRSAPSEVGVAFVDKVAPEIEILNMNATNPTSFDIKATDTVGLKRIDYSLWTDNNTRQLGVWGEWISGVEFTNNDNSITQYTSNVDPYSKLNFADLPEGEYTLRATAGDAAGNSKNATNFNFTVKTPTVVTPTDPEAPEPETPPVINPPSSSGESPDLTTGRFTPSNQTIAPLTATSPIPGITGAPYASTILNGQDSTASNDSSVLASEDNKLKNSDKDSDVLATNDAKDSDNKDGWSVINVVLAGLTAILSVIALIGIASKEDGKRIGARLATVVIAVGVIILVFFTENFSQPMIWLNWWTVLYAVLLAIQAMVKPSSHKDLQ